MKSYGWQVQLILLILHLYASVEILPAFWVLGCQAHKIEAHASFVSAHCNGIPLNRVSDRLGELDRFGILQHPSVRMQVIHRQ